MGAGKEGFSKNGASIDKLKGALGGIEVWYYRDTQH